MCVASSSAKSDFKYRAFFSEDSWTKNIKKPADKDCQQAHTEIDKLLDDPQWMCGAQLFAANHKLHSTVYNSAAMECRSPMEQELYKSTPATQHRVQFDRPHADHVEWHPCLKRSTSWAQVSGVRGPCCRGCSGGSDQAAGLKGCAS